MLHNGSAHTDGSGGNGHAHRPTLMTSATVIGTSSSSTLLSGLSGGDAGRTEKPWKRSLSMSSLAAPFVSSSSNSGATKKKSLSTSNGSTSPAMAQVNGSKRARGHGYSQASGMPLTPPAVAEDPERELGTEFSGSGSGSGSATGGYRQRPLHRSPPESIYISFPAIADDDETTTTTARQPPIVKA